MYTLQGRDIVHELTLLIWVCAKFCAKF